MDKQAIIDVIWLDGRNKLGGKLIKIHSLLLPQSADNNYHGMKLPLYVLAVIALVSTARSLVHLFAPDGGAGSIAGIDLSVDGADEIIFAFALWGSSQLLFAFIQWLVLLRYRSLVPLMYLFLTIEVLLRELIGWIKPIQFAHKPPGAIGNQVVLVLAIIMLGLCLWSSRQSLRA